MAADPKKTGQQKKTGHPAKDSRVKSTGRAAKRSRAGLLWNH